MKPGKIIILILGLLVNMPIWFFMLYTLLKAAEVDRLVWFLFIIYIPVSVLIHIIAQVVDGDD